MSGSFNVFVYGTLRSDGPAGALLNGAELLSLATVPGTLYDTGSGYPALVLAGDGRVQGEVWRCPSSLLRGLDEHEDVEAGLFRRVGVQIREWACWTYVAGPALSRRLTPERRIASGCWAPEAA